MLRNYLITALRHIRRHKVYSSIIVGGLAIGLSVVIVVALYVIQESEYDNYHTNVDRIYRIHHSDTGRGSGNAHTPPVLGEAIRQYFPDDVEKVVRIEYSRGDNLCVRHEGQLIPMENHYYAEPEIFDVFTMPLLHGDPGTALTDPNSIILSQQQARKYFPDTDPVGKILTIKRDTSYVDFQVTGVLKQIPKASHIRPEFILPAVHVLPLPSNRGYDPWGYNSIRTYVLLAASIDAGTFEEKLNTALHPLYPDWYKDRFYLEKVERIHLHAANIWGNFGTTGNILYVYIFSGITVLILLISCFNYINLTTAFATTRAKEAGIRTVVGAERKMLITQMLIESHLMSLLALPFAATIVELGLPYVNVLLDRELAVEYFGTWRLILVIIGTVAIVGFTAGSYSAFYLSSLDPIQAIKSQSVSHSSKSWFRRVSITIQFVIFIALVTSSLIFYRQLRYVQTKYPGYDTEHVLAIQMPNHRYTKTCDVLKNSLLQYPDVKAVSFASTIPPSFGNWGYTKAAPVTDPENGFQISWVNADANYQEVLQFKMLAGSYFSEDASDNAGQPIVINKSAAVQFGLENPVNETVTISGQQWQVIGVMDDIHLRSLYTKIMPLFISNSPAFSDFSFMSVRVAPANLEATLDNIKSTWDELFPDDPIIYSFLDDEFDRIYRADTHLGQLFGVFTILAIFLASIGLFGLSMFSAKRRTKEIGIRKVSGATVGQIVILLSREFVVLVVIANVIAWPVAWYAMHRWLENFAYRIELGLWVFVLAGVLALVIALATVSNQAIKAATANPVDALRYE